MKKRMYILAIICGVLLLGLVRFYITESDFSPSNPFWNGVSDLTLSMDVRPIYDLAGYGAMGAGDTLLIISPSRNFSASEADAVRAFLQTGGRVVVMDDFGMADSLLDGLGSPLTIARGHLYQYEDFYKNQSCPIVNASYGPGGAKYRLVLNHPAVLSVNGPATVLAYTSKYAWIDLNGDGAYGPNEKMKAYPVIASCSIGNGELIVISDPDILINSMIGKEDNRAFTAGIIRGRPWLDVTHGLEVVPLLRIYLALKFDFRLQALAVFLAAAGTGLAIWRRPLADTVKKWRKK